MNIIQREENSCISLQVLSSTLIAVNVADQSLVRQLLLSPGYVCFWGGMVLMAEHLSL